MSGARFDNGRLHPSLRQKTMQTTERAGRRDGHPGQRNPDREQEVRNAVSLALDYVLYRHARYVTDSRSAVLQTDAAGC